LRVQPPRPTPDTELKRTVPLILAVALFMENMDSTVISTSLPAIAADIGTSPVALKLALTAYLVSVAIFIPISAWMADRYGAKRVFSMAIAVFICGSLLSAASGSLIEFVGARFVQGMGGAMMTPIARLFIVRVSEKRDLVTAMAWLTVPGLIGPLAGPPVGGFITTFFSWHWIFLVNVPIGLIGILLVARFVPAIEPAGSGRIDVKGFLLAAIAASGIVFGLSVVSLPALPPVVGVLTLLVGICAVLLYVRHARIHPKPVLDLKLFRYPVFRIGVTGLTIFRIGNGAAPFLLPLLFQLGFGMTPFESGLLTFASAIGALAMKFLAPVTLKAGGFRTVLSWAAVIASAFSAVNGFFTPYTPPAVIIAVLLGSGFLRSLFFTAANVLIFSDIDERGASQATAIAAVAQQISVALGVAVGGGVLEIAAYATGNALTQSAFTAAFLVISLITASAALVFMRLAPDAGNAISGHRRRGASEDPTLPL
jgi:EmrB/QacA subfamily drug resistance transporter